jgi:putative ABC transport system permease protein
MFQNYLKIAWRNFLRNRAFSAINIVGLALGLASTMLISLYVLDELSFDRFHEKADQIVRVVLRGTMQGGKINEAHVMPPVGPTLKADYPEVLAATRFRQIGSPNVFIGEKPFTGDRITFADSTLFQVFTLPLIEGNAKKALVAPNTVVITEPLARKYYGSGSVLGKTLKIKGSNELYKVTGVIEKIPANSHFQFDIFVAMAGLEESRSDSWMTSEFFTYLLLQKGYGPAQLEKKLPQTIDKYIGPQLQKAMGVTIQEFRKSGNNIGLYLQPLKDIHLHSDSSYDLSHNGDIKYVYIFGAVAVFMLIIACINFMNLSTAGASRRAREVGVRKVMGSGKIELMWQFLFESVLLTLFALVLAAIVGVAVLPFFNDLSGKNLTLQPEHLPTLVPGILLFGLVVGVLSGSYPAFFLSSFRPITVLKGKQTTQKGSIGIRGGLVVFQFFISISLMIGTTVVFQQLKFIQNKKLGYDKAQVMVLDNAWALGKHQDAFKDEILRDPRITNVSISGFLPAGPSYNNNYMVYPDAYNTRLVKTLRYDVDFNYMATLGMELSAGRDFSKDFGTDSSAVILNETAAKMLGWNDNALNHTISHTDNDGTKYNYHVIGVVRDFHFKSLHEKITPLVMTLGKGAGTMIVKVKTDNLPTLVASMTTHWNTFKPEVPFSYTFLDERFNNTYRAEQKTGTILAVFAGLTIFVACLGLFGLATFMAEQRTKEIGVRKVLGASVASVVTLLSRDFLVLVVIAILLATPAAWYGMNRWLQGFEYKISITWWIPTLTAGLSILVALLTVSYQSIKAALTNPVDSLHAE